MCSFPWRERWHVWLCKWRGLSLLSGRFPPFTTHRRCLLLPAPRSHVLDRKFIAQYQPPLQQRHPHESISPFHLLFFLVC